MGTAWVPQTGHHEHAYAYGPFFAELAEQLALRKTLHAALFCFQIKQLCIPCKGREVFGLEAWEAHGLSLTAAVTCY